MLPHRPDRPRHDEALAFCSEKLGFTPIKDTPVATHKRRDLIEHKVG
ncbi:hypothetical protein [Sphingomonas gei]|nr:hypothetical protein [Sphingomonas gei]